MGFLDNLSTTFILGIGFSIFAILFNIFRIIAKRKQLKNTTFQNQYKMKINMFNDDDDYDYEEQPTNSIYSTGAEAFYNASNVYYFIYHNDGFFDN